MVYRDMYVYIYMYVCMYVCIGFRVYMGVRVGMPYIALEINLARAAVKDLGFRV